ncbi:MAG: hypothetical protein WAO00_11380, partial [Chthoniobacterales bacterium]
MRNKFEIYLGPQGEDLEIAGVLASVENWRRILAPLLKKPVEDPSQTDYLPHFRYEREAADRCDGEVERSPETRAALIQNAEIPTLTLAPRTRPPVLVMRPPVIQ